MKAAQYSQYGGPEVLEVKEAPKPSLKQNQVLVEVYAASINPFDYKLRKGYMKDGLPLSFPFTIGGDLSGIAVEVGEAVTDISVGDEVFGQAYNLGGSSGSMAEYTAANSQSIARKPKNINFNEAASLPLVGASAIQALEEHIKLQSGQKILIHGGAGGIGSIAIQLAKHLGAYVATTVGADDIEFAKSLGADEVINYATQNFAVILKEFDAVFDTVGGETLDKSVQVLRKGLPDARLPAGQGRLGGILVSMLGTPKEELVKQYGVEVIGQNTKTNAQKLARLADLVDQGVIKPKVDKTFSLDQVKDAFEYAENNHPKGKVVVSIKE